MIVDSGDAAKMRQLYYATRRVIVNIPRLGITDDPISASIFTPLPTLPTGIYVVDTESSEWTDGLAGMYVTVTREGVGVVWTGTLRADNELGNVFLAGRNTGDTGDSSDTAYDIEVDDIVLVYRVLTPHSYWSRIEPENLTPYKFWDLEYSDQNQYPPPQVNLGEHQCITLAPGETDVDVTFDASASFIWAGGLTARAWKTISPHTTGLEGSGDTWTKTREPGEYLGRCLTQITTDGGSKIDGAYRWVFVRGEGYESFSDKFPTIIESDDQDRIGRKLTLLVEAEETSDIATHYLYLGAPVLMTFDTLYSADAWETVDTVTDGVLSDNFYGYLRKVENVSQDANGIITYRLTVLSPALYMGELPNARQTFTVADPPTAWNEVPPNGASATRISWFLIRWNCPVILNHSDFIYLYNGTTMGAGSSPAYNFPQGSLLEGVLRAARYYSGGNFGSISSGGMYLRRNPVYEDATYRDTTLDTTFTWTAPDLSAAGGELLSLNQDWMMASYETRGKFIASSTSLPVSAFAARTNLFAPAHAVRPADMEDFIAGGESEGLQRLGHHHQRLNKPIQSFTIKPYPHFDFIEPALMEWHEFNLSALDPSILTDTGITRAIPDKVVRQWNVILGKGLTRSISASFEPESTGYPAILDPTDLGSVYGQWLNTDKFNLDDGGWELYLPDASLNFLPAWFDTTNRGVYTAGVGWQGQTFLKTGDSLGDYRAGLAIKRTFSLSALTSISFKFKSPNNTLENLNIALAFHYTSGSVQTQRALNVNYGTVEYTVTFPPTSVIEVGIAIMVHHPTLYPTIPTLKKVILGGDGDNPF